MFIFARTGNDAGEAWRILIAEDSRPDATARFGEALLYEGTLQKDKDPRCHEVGVLLAVRRPNECEFLVAGKGALGNGLFGAGWAVGIPQVTRKTDRKFPEYLDSEDSDTFLLSGAEDLVPFLDGAGERVPYPDDDENTVERYRPRTEGLYAIIERVKTPAGDVFWRSITRDHTTSIFGQSADARITDPDRPRRVFSWLLERTEDAYGHVTTYAYDAEDFDNAVRAAPSEAHRRDGLASFANRHLKKVRYANSTPGDEATYQIEVIFDYGEHDAEVPTATEETTWPVRQDPFSSYRAGFDMRTYRLCRRVLVFHKFTGLESGTATLVRSLDLAYDENPTMTKLTSATLKGYIKDGGAYIVKAMPPLVMTYSEPTFTKKIVTLEKEQVEDFPRQLLGKEAQFLDLDGEGLPGVLTRRGDAVYYQRNRGDGTLTLQKCLPLTPSLITARDAQLTDVEGGGTMAVVSWGASGAGFQLRDGEGWGPFQAFASQPNVNWNDPNLRFVDLNGDGFADILITRGDHFLWYPSLGKQGFGPARRVEVPQDDRIAPSVVFNDVKMQIYLADMTGDGMADIVRIRNGKVSYWPSLGFGRFGVEIRMGNCPYLGNDEQFRNVQVKLADLDGSGTADMLFFSPKGMEVFFNRAGNSFSEGFLNPSVPAEALWTLQLVDYYGRGMTAVAWAPPEIGLIPAPLKVTQPCGAEKPHLLKTLDNSMGMTVTFTYAPSTKFYAADRKARRPWATKLPFPVEVVEQIETRDAIARTRYLTSFSYRHGYYDTVEREFRGFGRVDQLDAEWFGAPTGAGTFTHPPVIEDHDDEDFENDEFPQAPVLTKTWFHTGAFKTVDRRLLEDAFLTESWLGDLTPAAAPRSEVPTDDDLTPAELREAYRALRGTMIRQEVYGLDGSADEDKPFAVVEQSIRVRLKQHQSPRKGAERPAFYAVFDAVPLEARTTTYERIANDPRTMQELALEVDEFGGVTRAASIAYARRDSADFDEQDRSYIVVAEADFVSLTTREDYRLSAPTESRVYELTNAEPDGAVFTRAELAGFIGEADPIAYDATPVGEDPHLRLVERTRTIYYDSTTLDPDAPFAFGTIDALALPFQSYRLDLLASQLTSVFGGELDTALLTTDGAYIELFEDEFWIPSGFAILDDAHFFLPTEFKNPYGIATTVAYDAAFNFATSVTDVYGNVVAAEIDYRLLRPSLTTDPNGNQTTTVSDELGMLTKLVVMGKDGADDGDTIDHPTVEYTIVLDNWTEHDSPNYIHVEAREEHFSEVPASAKFQISRTYSDGSGRVACAKAKFASDGMTARWVTSGKTVVNNKGNPIKQYEPFFSATIDYEEEEAFAEIGVTPLLTYDALGRMTRIDLPNGTYRRSEWTAWSTTSFDENDTVGDDGNLWAEARVEDGPASDAEERALRITLPHANTPTVTHFDPMGRAFLVITDNGFTEDEEPVALLFETRIAFDIESQILSVKDALGRTCQTNVYSMAGQLLSDTNIDKGTRRRVSTVDGQLLRRWDDRNQIFRAEYDDLRRLTHLWVTVDDLEDEEDTPVTTLLERRYYGEAVADPEDANVRGRLVYAFDGAGLAVNDDFDFKGNPLSTARRLFDRSGGDQVPDWVSIDEEDNPLDATTSAPIEAETFTASAEFDALNRVTKATAPNGAETIYAYDLGGALFSVTVDTVAIVEEIHYDAHSRRESIEYGNGVTTTYEYDPLTFRLAHLVSTRASDSAKLQDLRYTLDPVGNILAMADAVTEAVYFDDNYVDASTEYKYDALYRLTWATGREHGSNIVPVQSDDGRFIGSVPDPNDPQALRQYIEEYAYDAVSNLTEMSHEMVGNSAGDWTRTYSYTSGTNRLASTTANSDPSIAYTHDDHGNIIAWPHLPEVEFSPLDQMWHAELSTGHAYYYYDSGGNRVRKVVVNGSPTKERIYLGGFEYYRETTTVLDFERTTLHVMDGARRVCMIETKTIEDEDEDPVTPLVPAYRYQLVNHLETGVVECDDNGAVFSFEEYSPYGVTMYQSRDTGVEVSAKRYRFASAERDDETGFYCMGARYYCPWLGRWTTADPLGLQAGINVFAYCRGSPVTLSDPSGLDETISVNPNSHSIVYSTTVTLYTGSSDPDVVRETAGRAEDYYANRQPSVARELFGQTVGGALETLFGSKHPRTYYEESTRTSWTVEFDVHYEVVEGDAPVMAMPPEGSSVSVGSILDALAAGGLEPGDNMMAYRPADDPGFKKGVEGRTYSMSIGVPATDLKDAAAVLQPELPVIHETGHLLGFHERYWAMPGTGMDDFEFEEDMMRSSRPGPISMSQRHVDDAARFALELASEMSSTGRLDRFEIFGATIDVPGVSTTDPTYEATQQAQRTREVQRQRELRWPSQSGPTMLNR
ncbi:MAG: SpvB/TcaC N-terminal domain-containing protein [Patescibacteria group bacterium]